MNTTSPTKVREASSKVPRVEQSAEAVDKVAGTSESD
jgi:hypothetical protein